MHARIMCTTVQRSYVSLLLFSKLAPNKSNLYESEGQQNCPVQECVEWLERVTNMTAVHLESASPDTKMTKVPKFVGHSNKCFLKCFFFVFRNKENRRKKEFQNIRFFIKLKRTQGVFSIYIFSFFLSEKSKLCPTKRVEGSYYPQISGLLVCNKLVEFDC